MLGAIVAAASGLSYYDYLRRNIFSPTGMTHTDFPTKPQVLADSSIAHGYLTQPTGGRIDVTTTPDWVILILSNYDTTIRPIADLARTRITHH